MRVGFEETLFQSTFVIDFEKDLERAFEMKQLSFEKLNRFAL